MDGDVRVLHVDDPEAAVGLERECPRLSVAPVTSASDAMARIDAEDVDCVVADYELPDGTGIELLEAVRDDQPDLPFILFTGTGSERVASAAIAADVTGYVRKGEGQYADLVRQVCDAVETHRERRRIERSQRRLQTVYERITDGFFGVDADWTYTYVNEAGADLVDRRRDALVGETVWNAFPDLADSPFGAALRDAMESQETITVEEYYPPHDAWYDVRVYPSADGISIYFQDVTERKRERQELEARARQQAVVAKLGRVALSREPLASLFDRAVEAVAATLDVPYAGVFEHRPNEAEFVLRAGEGWEKGQVGESTIAAGTNAQMGYTLRSATPISVEDLRAEDRFDGSALLAEHGVVSGISVIVGAADDPWGVLGVHAPDSRSFGEDDVNFVESVANVLGNAIESRERKRALERQNDRLEEFVGVVSHDIRNPLNVAQGRTALAREECDSAHIDDVADALDQCQILIDDLLALAREGDRVGDVEPVALADAVARCWRTVETAGATLVVETEGTVPADPNRLEQLLTNLLQNAADHGGDGRTQSCGRGDAGVTITVGDLDDGFYVADDGPGIPSADRERVFEAGYSTADAGTGFGLNIVREIVEAHGWTVAVADSEAGGARFEITGVGAGE
jgi:PAS domain S-box-containing protein